MKLLVLLPFIFISSLAFSFVENTTKGYANCLACHVSNNGGGLLNDYGRALSQELMSTYTINDNFANPYYGAVKNTENIKFGGQFRHAQIQVENKTFDQKKQFDMQNNLEFGFKYMKAFFVGTIGTKEGPNSVEDKDEFLSERHYIQYQTGETSYLRAGKFRQHFGINHPNHTRYVKADLGFGSYSETYNLEASQFFEWGEFNLSTSLGKFDSDFSEDNNQRNIAFNLTHYLEGNSRLGLSLLHGRSDSYKRNLTGVNLVTGLGKKWTLRHELDYEQVQNIAGESIQNQINGLYGDHQLEYLAYKGVIPYLFFQHAQSNMKIYETLKTAPGIGFKFRPIAHVEIQGEYQQQTNHSDDQEKTHISYLMLHLYH